MAVSQADRLVCWIIAAMTKKQSKREIAQRPDELIGYRIRRLASLLAQHGKLVTRQSLDMTQAEWRILMSLSVKGPSNPNLVAEEAGLERSHVTQATRSLRRRRLVSQQKDGNDGRRVLLSLTKTGRALLDRGIEMYAPRRAALAEALTAEEQAVFDRAIVKLIHTAEHMLAERKAGKDQY
jgi:DNA-binding MarR family transcriptional regulator